MGASKALIELAEELEPLGWECKMLSPADLMSEGKGNGNDKYHIHLYHYLREHAAEYDVVDYDHNYLPYARSEFHPQTLFVARAVLLAHHFAKIPLPEDKRLKPRLHRLIINRNKAERDIEAIRNAHTTLCEADLINVANDDDRAELVEHGVPEDKVFVAPYGISRSQRELFNAVSSKPPAEPLVAFVGTFDKRKGSTDFPQIVEADCSAVPRARFRLLGTYLSEREVLASFPKKLKNRIEVVPQYAPERLPELLAPCAVGVFPSYIEGFGLGVLEMLAASIPVIAYNAPGPPMMLPPGYLVPRGATYAMSAKVIKLLNDQESLAAARLWAKQRSQEFCWRTIAQKTNQIYLEHWQKKQSNLFRLSAIG